jgi:predicted nucleotidyltransferase
MELVKQVVKVGNSAGVVLPREWLNGMARVELVRKPINIKKDVLEIVDEYLEDVLGVYLVGSYARGEETKESDVDILVVTSEINKKIKKGKYNVIMISEKELKDVVGNVVLPFVPMIREAKVLMNWELIDGYKDAEITWKGLKWHIELAKSALKINKKFINIDQIENEMLGDGIAYSLILNLRTVYIIDCLRKNKLWSTKELLKLIKGISGSLNFYEGYLRSKNGAKEKKNLKVDEAIKLYEYVSDKLKELEKWLKARKK